MEERVSREGVLRCLCSETASRLKLVSEFRVIYGEPTLPAQYRRTDDPLPSLPSQLTRSPYHQPLALLTHHVEITAK